MVRHNRMAPTRRFGARARLMAMAVASCYASAPAWAVDGAAFNAVVGSVTASQTGNVKDLTLTTTTDRTLAEIQKRFNLASDETLRITQPSSSSLFMLRVVRHEGVLERSVIDGSIYSNGQFWLQNAAGALISKGAVIDTAGFLATSMAVRLDDFMAARLTSLQGLGTGDIVNRGEIKTSSGGSVYLVGANVTNEGVITTPGGETILAAGQTVNLVDTGTPGVKVEITGEQGDVTNLGNIVATAGRIGMAGVIVRNSGTLNASSVVSDGGRVFLKASKDTYVDGAGRIVATGTKGGRVEVLGERVAVMDQAQIDASGTNGGGTVLIGGDYQGKNVDVKNATITYFGREASIKADAMSMGDGGKVIVWADDTTRAYGNISARGGTNGGNGGFVEVSGHNYLDFHARVDMRAPNGAAGTLLLDPADVTISNAATSGGSFTSQVFSYGGGAASSLSWADIITQLGLGNVVITTTGTVGNGDITINSSPTGGSNINISHSDSWGTWSDPHNGAGYNSSNSLSLLANRAVNINAWFGNAGTGAINIMAGWNGASTSTPVVYGGFTAGQSININSGGGIASKGAVSLTAVDSVNISGGASSAGIDLDTGALSIIANSLILTGGSSGTNNAQARIATNENQTYTVGKFNSSGVLRLTGSNGMATYGGGAEISLYGSSGTQNFTIENGAAVELRGGSSNGYMPGGGTTGSCSVGAVCSNNGANIRNNGNGGQSFVFTAGGDLGVYGGNTGNSNSAGISNNGTGSQAISGASNIRVQGGSSGGATVVYGGKVETLENSAEIDSKYGAQIISAATMTLEGGTAAYGGAFVSAPVQNITVSGALTLTGGTGTAPSGYDIYGNVILTNAAILGNDVTNTINLNVGSLSMQGGTSSAWGGSWALIGGYRVPSTISVVSGGNIVLTGGAQGASRIGSIGGYGGSVSLTSTLGSISLDNAYIGTGSTGSVTINGYGGITQGATGRIETSTLVATATQAGADVQFAGENRASYVSIVSPDILSYIGVAPTHLTSLISTGGNISASISNLYGYGGWVGLGSLAATNGSVNVSASQQIVDDNGSGVANITAKSITLVSNGGTTDSTGLAISADVGLAASGTFITATVSNSATYGGISIRNGSAVAPATVTLTDQSTYAGSGKVFYSSLYDIDMSSANFSLTSDYGPVTIWSGGFLTLGSPGEFSPGVFANSTYGYVNAWGQTGVATSANMNFATAIDLYVGTNGSMTIGHGISNVRNIGLYAAGNLDFLSGSSIDATSNAYLGGAASALAGAATASTYGGGAVTLNNAYVKALNGTIVAYSGGDIRLNNGSYLQAGYDVNLGLGAATSNLYLNDAAGYANSSYIFAGTGRYINIGLPARSADGVVIDGNTTMTSTAGGSGLFIGNHSTPAVKAAGLNVVYGVAASAAISAVLNEVVSSITTTTESVDSSTTQQSTLAPLLPPSGGGTSSLASLATGTVGGGTGEFGGSDTSSAGITTGTTTTTSGGTSTDSGSGTSATTGTSGSGEGGQSSSSGGESSSAASGDQQDNGGKDGNGKDKKDDKKDDKKQDKKAEGEKKDDKASKKPVGKCSA